MESDSRNVHHIMKDICSHRLSQDLFVIFDFQGQSDCGSVYCRDWPDAAMQPVTGRILAGSGRPVTCL